MHSCAKVGPLIDTDGSSSFDDQHKSDIFNNFFSMVFTNDDGKLPAFPKAMEVRSADIDFSPMAVSRALKKLKPGGAAGPDLFPALFWYNSALGLAYPLSVIFTTSYASSCIPDEWHLAIVVPIFKKGSPFDPSNYRPVSLSCILCKVMESIIKMHMLTFLKSNKLLSLNQHGFAANKSTFTQLVECLRYWTSAAKMRLQVHIIHIDFKKAYDSVSHNKLLFELTQMGFSNKLTDWISSFLLCRLQRVRCNNFLSCYKTVTSGVLQGSVLGPILFTVFINDLANMRLECKIKLFADDLKIYKIIRSILDCDILQRALNVISNWSNE